VVEFTDLSADNYQTLCGEVLAATRLMRTVSQPDKINVAVLGTVVPQMHVHVIGRFRNDAAWPDAVWCHGAGPLYGKDELEQVVDGYRIVAERHSCS
jgi:diadenosine tetraphosphate (Ap4A) HIT family hydrolase